jgi:hypothetical protein
VILISLLFSTRRDGENKMRNFKSKSNPLICIGGNMRWKVPFALVAMCVVLMTAESFARDTCYVATDTCYVCRTLDSTSGFYITGLDFGVCDTVRIGCPFIIPTIIPGDSILVPIYVWNDELLGGLTLGFKFNPAELEIVKKRFDLTGSCIPPGGIENGLVKEMYDAVATPGQYLLGWVNFGGDPGDNIPVNTTNKAKLLVTLNFKVKAGAAPMHITIDSAYYPPLGPFVLSVAQIGVSVHPQYVHCPEGDIILGNILCGDADGSGDDDIADAVYTIAYIFNGGPAPNPLASGDADCDGVITIADAVYLIAYIFSGGPGPCPGCW